MTKQHFLWSRFGPFHRGAGQNLNLTSLFVLCLLQRQKHAYGTRGAAGMQLLHRLPTVVSDHRRWSGLVKMGTHRIGVQWLHIHLLTYSFCPFLIFYTFLIPFLLDRCQPSSSGKTSSSAGASCSRCLEAFEVFLLHRSLLLDQTENSLPGTIDVVLESMRRIRQLVCFPFCLSLICLS